MADLFGHNFTGSNDPNWVPEPDRRGTFNILSTCLVTLGLCVWTAIHLNVPEHKEGWVKQLVRKAGWMLMGLLSPEAIAYTAYQQHYQARAISQAMNSANNPSDHVGYRCRARNRGPWRFVTSLFTSSDSIEDEAVGVPKWTIAHGFLAVMGGFAIEINEIGNANQRRSKGLEDLIPVLPRESIDDKSKGSTLAKALVCFQASWFCIGCVNRFAQGLSISLLELNTLGHALCTLFIYAMWWHKPLDVGEPEKISLDASLTGEDLINGSKLLAAMCVHSELDDTLSEVANLYEEPEAFVFDVEYKYLEQTASFGCTINKNIAVCPEDLDAAYPNYFDQLDGMSEQKPYLIHSLVYSPLMQKYALKKSKLAPPTKCLVIIRKSDALLELVRTTSGDATERIISNEQRSDVWANVLLRDRDFKWREPEGTGKKKMGTVPEFLSYKLPDVSLPDHGTVKCQPNPPQVPLVSRPFIDISHSDMRRWQLAMAYENILDIPSNLLVDRARNLPRFEDYEQYTSLYFGFGLVSLIYGALHCLAWNAPFTSVAETILWRLSSMVIAASGIFVVALSAWQRYPPFRYISSIGFVLAFMVSLLEKRYLKPIAHILSLEWVDSSSRWSLADRMLAEYRAMHLLSNWPRTWRGVLYLSIIATVLALFSLPIFVFFAAVIPAMFLPLLLRLVFDIATCCFIPLYFLARGYLVVVSFINLAHLSDSAYLLPSWSKYVPHIG
ncbi:uncharacterized protein B0T23DRAFT_420022 [Neurospora hispaniola]|uniref:Uncharacterized protein n=1 Tax=Neurospora hispaniola TaxID=588809 RepID=A0AAJ0I778_9PEZI|nr:hypothetical protein B0T23DRAFT_420022 [Neurospora hispaniola]